MSDFDCDRTVPVGMTDTTILDLVISTRVRVARITSSFLWHYDLHEI